MLSACSVSVERICESEFSETLEARDVSEDRVSETMLEALWEALHEERKRASTKQATLVLMFCVMMEMDELDAL